MEHDYDEMDLMLELVSSEVNGDEVDMVIGADCDIRPEDFDPSSDEGTVMGMIDMLMSPSDVKSEI